MTYCRNCGNKMEDSDKFCSKCGEGILGKKEKAKGRGKGKVVSIILLTIILVSGLLVTLAKLNPRIAGIANLDEGFGIKGTNIDIGDYIEFGNYLNEPIVWRVINKDENGIMLFSDKILCFKAFDARGDEDEFEGNFSEFTRWGSGSNYWALSNLREWLNSNEEDVSYTRNPPTERNTRDGNPYVYERGFLTNFNKDELDIIEEVTHKTLLSEEDIYLADGGMEPVSYYEDLNFDSNNYDNSYYQYITDKVFLLSIKELKEYVYDRGWDYRAISTPEAIEESEGQHLDPIPYDYSHRPSDKYAAYWLRTPSYVYSYNTYMVEYSGGIYTVPAFAGEYGVRPSLYIKENVKVAQGDGSKDKPYILKGSSSKNSSDKNHQNEYSAGSMKKGNIAGNIANGGLAVQNIDWVYYSNEYGIYRIHPIGGNSDFVNETIGKSLNLIGDTLYYIEEDIYSENLGIHKMKAKGKKKETISRDRAKKIFLLGEYIFYINLDEGDNESFGPVYKIKIDGTNRKRITNENARDFSIADNEMFYINSDDGNKIYKIGVDGKKNKKLANNEAKMPIVVDDWIYYINTDDDNHIYRMRRDGSDVFKYKEISTDMSFNVSDGYIYYSNRRDQGSLYKASINDERNYLKLNYETSSHINILEDKIYYITPSLYSEGFFIKKIDINGGEVYGINEINNVKGPKIYEDEPTISQQLVDLSKYMGVHINDLIYEFGEDYWTDYFAGGQYYAFTGLDAAFFPDDYGNIRIIMGFDGTSYKDIAVGMMVDDVKNILGEPDLEGYDDVSDDYNNPYYFDYYLEDITILIRSETLDGPIKKIDIRSRD